ncbi:MAG: MerC domain-containing protein [Bacteroidota bacterium]|nr:MerC domain-containing protein [Bacteroidota bacterium]
MRLKINWDGLGVTASIACAIHCALLPLIFTSLPIFGFELLDNPGFEIAMIAIAASIGCYSLFHGYNKHHHRVLPIFIFLAGILFLCAKQIWHEQQMWLLPPAVALIVMAHYINYKSCKKAAHCHADDCDH